ncbi:MAG: ATP-binding protein [Deltaproteobacteria bacterium]|jgi:predicted ATPase|nr:ATP-binding protein [Deltaproteobacteria bacterium]
MRISLSGPHGAGKTTLFEELKKHLAKLDYAFYPEIARTLINLEPEIFSDKKGFEERLYRIHKTREHESFKEQNAVLDRCVWDTFVYADYYGYPLDKNEIEDTLSSCIDVIFVFPPIVGHIDSRLIELYQKHAQNIMEVGQTVYFVEFFNLTARVDFILDVLNAMPLGCQI